MKIFQKEGVFVFILLFSLSCGRQTNDQSDQHAFVHTNGLRLVDTAGQPLLLRGLNIMDKTASGGHFEGLNRAAFDSIRSWGMNVVRLGIFWEGIAPAPGQIDPSYLQQLSQHVALAKKAGLYVLLDMHQDLYSEKYGGDGAPAWACLDEGKPHIKNGSSWDDAYFSSPAIQTAFDNFWANKKLADGTGIQDHYCQAWKAVAERFADNPTVIGYDIMNEPFIGSPIKKVMQTYFKVLTATLKKRDSFYISGEKELMQLWMSADGRARIMQLLDDTTLFKQLMDATEPIYAGFEQEKLQPFYQKVFTAIQSVDTNHLIFLEPSVSANIGVKSHLKNTFGKRMVYAPHTYDLVTDTKQQESYSSGRLRIILHRHSQKQQKLEVPMVMGEWGAFYGADRVVIPQAQFILHYMDSLQCGNIYWAYQKDLRKRSYFHILYNQ